MQKSNNNSLFIFIWRNELAQAAKVTFFSFRSFICFENSFESLSSNLTASEFQVAQFLNFHYLIRN